jgi:hypothetical protein
MNRRWREGQAMVLADEHRSTAFLDVDSTLGRPHAKTTLAGLREFDVGRLPGRCSRFRCWAKVGDQAVVYQHQENPPELIGWNFREILGNFYKFLSFRRFREIPPNYDIGQFDIR